MVCFILYYVSAPQLIKLIGLAVDPHEKKLYVADSEQETITVTGFNGGVFARFQCYGVLRLTIDLNKR